MTKATDFRCNICHRPLFYKGVGRMPNTCPRKECQRAVRRLRRSLKSALYEGAKAAIRRGE